MIIASFKALPNADTPRRTHVLGMTVYNSSEENVSDEEWEKVLGYINQANALFLKNISGNPDQAAHKEVLKYDIILLPSRTIYFFGSELNGFVYFLPGSIFIRRDRINVYRVCHEWTHAYLHLTGKGLWSNIKHNDPLFFECRNP